MLLLVLMKQGVRLIALRCASFNQVDLEVADHVGIDGHAGPAYCRIRCRAHAGLDPGPGPQDPQGV